MRELSDAQRARLADVTVSPWDGGAAMEDETHRAALEVLFEATGMRGLPMPGGFLLDPGAIAERLALPRLYGWQVPLGYHPLFGVLVGSVTGAAERRAVTPQSHTWTTRDPTYGEPQAVARCWPELVDYLFALGDALARAYVIWVRVGDRRRMGERDARRWSHHRHVLEARSKRRFETLCDALGVRDAFAHGVTSVKLDASGGTTVVALHEEALVASDDADAIERALRVASAARELATPHAHGGYQDHGRPEAPTHSLCYAFPEQDAGQRILARRDGSTFAWAWSQDGRVNVARRVAPGRSPAGAAPCLADASPRLHRALARLGAFFAEPLRSVDGVRAWLDTQGIEGWDVLTQIETKLGGLVLAPAFGLGEPNRLGPFMVLADRESLEPLGLHASRERDGDESGAPDSDFVQRPWPFVSREGIELAVVGYENTRIDSAVCADAAGVMYFLDHEFDELTPRANDALTLLEKVALWTELFDDRRGVAGEAAFALTIDVGEEAPQGLGLTEVREASDAISATYLGDGAALSIRHAHPLRPARTDVYAPEPSRAVDLARELREVFADATLHVRVTTSAASQARRGAFAKSGLEDVELTPAHRWARLS